MEVYVRVHKKFYAKVYGQVHVKGFPRTRRVPHASAVVLTPLLKSTRSKMLSMLGSATILKNKQM